MENPDKNCHMGLIESKCRPLLEKAFHHSLPQTTN